ncbi:hypothetical protein Fcan01_24463 [Folsomia candida]|uniref:Uncharacterized protein n=1 Tax=Folsomia candida TaxID=158441 RepID=A0A226D644_FOLCA|nr:hypothetical protein Fcan01_24463 [Folsomia candida]
MSTNSVETRVFSSLFGAIQDSGPICLDLVVPQDDRYAEDHPVVPCYQSRSATCGHLVHQGCAANYVIRCGRVFSLEYEDEVSLSEWRTRCWCRFDSDSFRTADISIVYPLRMEGDLESLSNRPSDPPSEDAFLDPPVVDENREPIEEYFFEAEVVLTPLQPVAPSHNAVSLVPVVPTLAEDAAERTSGNKSTTELDPTMDTADEQSSWSTGSWRDEPYECAHCEFTSMEYHLMRLHDENEHPLLFECMLCYLENRNRGVILDHLPNFHRIRGLHTTQFVAPY